MQSGRLFAVSSYDGALYALEDLHSFEPGLPGAVYESQYPLTIRALTSGPMTAGVLGQTDSPPGEWQLYLNCRAPAAQDRTAPPASPWAAT